MSGHSKWHNIKRKKEVEDAKRSKIFTKIARLLTVVARKGGENPNMNSALRMAIEKAKHARMPKENIERAVRRGVGDSSANHFDEVVYEGYGVEGVAFMIFSLTDNKNRTVAEIKNTLSKFGGSLGQPGCVSYIFSSSEPSFVVDILDKEKQGKILDLVSALEEHDDVQEVYSDYNFI